MTNTLLELEDPIRFDSPESPRGKIWVLENGPCIIMDSGQFDNAKREVLQDGS